MAQEHYDHQPGCDMKSGIGLTCNCGFDETVAQFKALYSKKQPEALQQPASVSLEEMFEFVEWVGEDVWVKHKYDKWTDGDEIVTTSQLFSKFQESKLIKSK